MSIHCIFTLKLQNEDSGIKRTKIVLSECHDVVFSFDLTYSGSGRLNCQYDHFRLINENSCIKKRREKLNFAAVSVAQPVNCMSLVTKKR